MSDSRLLKLPRELRDVIYEHLFHPACNRTYTADDDRTRYHYDLASFRVNRQLYQEAQKAFQRLNAFATIETPFAETHEYISIQGNVPIIAKSSQKNHFKYYHLAIKITVPGQDTLVEPLRLLVHVDDVESFCKVWFYSQLSNPPLNPHLHLALHLKNPTAPSENDNPVPKALQKRLLEPFGMVKSLLGMQIVGQVYSSIEEAVRTEQKKPVDSPELCFERSFKLKEEGNQALKDDPHKAIELYLASFEAIHIICRGRHRTIWAEEFFHTDLTSGEHSGKNANVVRLVMRVKLTANIIQAYLKLKNFEEARFWGMRSINLVRQNMGAQPGEEEAFLGFEAATEMGKIYYRTGIAERELGNRAEARGLLRVAMQYLPHDKLVRQAHASVALRI